MRKLAHIALAVAAFLVVGLPSAAASRTVPPASQQRALPKLARPNDRQPSAKPGNKLSKTRVKIGRRVPPKVATSIDVIPSSAEHLQNVQSARIVLASELETSAKGGPIVGSDLGETVRSPRGSAEIAAARRILSAAEADPAYRAGLSEIRRSTLSLTQLLADFAMQRRQPAVQRRLAADVDRWFKQRFPHASGNRSSGVRWQALEARREIDEAGKLVEYVTRSVGD